MNSTCLHAHTQVYPPVKWFYVLVAYLVTPLFALPNSYGCGLTDWDMSSMYAKLALFIFAAWAGTEVRGAHCVFVCGWVCVCVCVCWQLPLLDTGRCQAGGTHTHTPHTHAHTARAVFLEGLRLHPSVPEVRPPAASGLGFPCPPERESYATPQNAHLTPAPPPTHTRARQNAKFAVRPDTLPDGVRVPAGALMLYSAYAINRLREFWGEDADEFR